MGLVKDFQIVVKEGFGKIIWSLCSNPIVLLTLLTTFYICLLKFNFESKNIPKYFWISDWVTLVTWTLKKDELTSKFRKKNPLIAFVYYQGWNWFSFRKPVTYFFQVII